MRRLRNLAFALLVVTAVFASGKGVLADWGNWQVAGYYSYDWYGGCIGWWDCDPNRRSECELLCSNLYTDIFYFWCYYDGGSAEYPDDPNCWAMCDCRIPGK